MLVKELREELKQRGLPTTGKKAELEARLEAAVASEGQENGEDAHAAQQSDGPASAPEDAGTATQPEENAALEPVAESADAPAAADDEPAPDEQEQPKSSEAVAAVSEPPAAAVDNNKEHDTREVEGVTTEQDPRDSTYEDPASSLSLGSDEPDDTADPMADAETSARAEAAPEAKEARKGSETVVAEQQTADTARSPVRDSPPAGSAQPRPAPGASLADRETDSAEDTRESALHKAAKLDSRGRRGPSVSDVGGRHGAGENRSHVQHSGAGAPERTTAGHRTSTSTDKAPTDQRSRKRAREIVFEAPRTSKPSEPSVKREHVEREFALPRGETRALFIKGFKRPLREPELKKVLSEQGPLEGFWLEMPLKSWCYAVYSSVDFAVETYKAVNGRRWPERACGSVMDTSFVALEEAQAVIEAEGAVTVKRPGVHASARGAGNQSRSQGDNGAAVRDTGAPRVVPKTAVERAVQRDASVVVVESEEEGDITEELRRTQSQEGVERKARPVEHAVAVDDLFRKTIAEPVIYWLPLGDEEVAARAAVEQARKNGQHAAGAEGPAASAQAAAEGDDARRMSIGGS